MNIIKIGGSVFESSKSFEVFTDYLNKNERQKLLIISAFGKISSQIRDSIENLTFDFEFIKYLRSLSADILSQSKRKEYNEIINTAEQDFTDTLQAMITTDEKPKPVIDRLLAYGEILSLQLMELYLNQHNIDFTPAPSTDLLVTDKNYGEASVKNQISINRIKQFFNNNGSNNLYLTTGFIAKDEDGNLTTMGFESSNLTAMIFANALNTKNIEIISTVEGIQTADPNLVSGTKLVTHLNYNNAKLLMKNGLKLFFKGMIKLADKNNIEIIYSNFDSKNRTHINRESVNSLPVIHKNDNYFVIASIEKGNALKVINKYFDKIEFIDYSMSSLKFESNKLELQTVHDYVLSLY